MSVQPRKPLFVFLPGMDGSGTLLHTQLAALEPWFDLRCLAIPPEDDAGWTRLTQQVIQLIRAEVSQTESPAVVTHSGQNLEPPKSWVKRPLKRDQLKKGQLKRGRQVTGSNKTIRRSVSRRSVYLCGESFGGCLAMHVLIRAPELFDRVILVNPASSFRRLPWMQLGQMITQRLPSSVYRYGALGLVPFLIDPFRVRQQDRKALEKAMDAVPPKTAAWRMSLLSEFEAERLPLERMTHPVLLIAGGRDRLLPSKREVQDLHRRFPHAQQHLLPNSGHACLLEKDVNLYQILRQCDFLESHIGA
ncbi:MAG: alpha/beta hydrolase [Cyanobacteria bacterium P01_D01_bin.105]